MSFLSLSNDNNCHAIIIFSNVIFYTQTSSYFQAFNKLKTKNAILRDLT
jgi:hypothetical protein